MEIAECGIKIITHKTSITAFKTDIGKIIEHITEQKEKHNGNSIMSDKGGTMQITGYKDMRIVKI